MIFNPMNKKCKRPFGAVPSGAQVKISACPPRQDGFSGGVLNAQFEQRDHQIVSIPLTWRAIEGSQDIFSGSINTDGYIGLVWYSIILEGFQDRRWQSPTYQLTVYDNSEEPPSWFGEGVTYQILPDRFFRLSIPDPTGMVGGRTVHQNWLDDPDYLPDENGEIKNRDFFGGSLTGIASKLPYLKQLGIDTIYLCPVFEGAENHHYGTGDYEKIDPMLGSAEDFSDLCNQAHQMGMHIILDGVFNHTGFVSRYFNGDGSYPGLGAAQSQDSPYYPWYHFYHWPDQYDCWWGIYSLPSVEETEDSYQKYIATGKDSIIRRWLHAGADGWRLDVADELPDFFIYEIHKAAREENPSAVVIGEVWEDGSQKIAYDVRRHHLWGGHCDGLMNYPFRTALLSYLLGGDAENFRRDMEVLQDHYPHWAFYGSMNFLGTHDTLRILTLLGEGSDRQDTNRIWRASHRLSPEQRRRGIGLLKAAAVILFSFPGSPTVYYGDEIGMEGFEDPFNRRTYPWGQEDRDLLAWFSSLSHLRHTYPSLQNGILKWHTAQDGILAFIRGRGKQALLATSNRTESPAVLIWRGHALTVPPLSGALWNIKGEKLFPKPVPKID